jgi:hypothetical protein
MKSFLTCVAIGSLCIIVPAHAQRGGGRGVAALPEPNRALRVEPKAVKGLPYSAEIKSESIQTLADGNRIVQVSTGRIFRDSEGRTRREEDRASGSPTISITDVVAGTSYTLNAERRVATQTANPLLAFTTKAPTGDFVVTLAQEEQKKIEALVAGLRTAREAEEKALAIEPGKIVERYREEIAAGRGFNEQRREESVQETLQDRVIDGVLATGSRRTTTIAAGAIGNERPITIVSEEWFSPDLQILVMTERTDPRLGRSTYRVSNINRNEPDPTLFQVPSDYILRKPGIK